MKDEKEKKVVPQPLETKDELRLLEEKYKKKYCLSNLELLSYSKQDAKDALKDREVTLGRQVDGKRRLYYPKKFIGCWKDLSGYWKGELWVCETKSGHRLIASLDGFFWRDIPKRHKKKKKHIYILIITSPKSQIKMIYGVFRATSDKEAKKIADRYSDTDGSGINCYFERVDKLRRKEGGRYW